MSELGTSELGTCRRGRRAVSVLALIGAVWGPAPAGAITNGTADNGAHPNVGTVIWRGADGVLFRSCSGTLVSPTVFLTAAHCVALHPAFPGEEPVGVSFAGKIEGEPTSYLPGTGVAHPAFVWGSGSGYGATGPGKEEYDIGVVVLDEPLTTVAPARLPTLNQLDVMNRKHGLRGMTFTVVGYGATDAEKPGAVHCCGPVGERRVATETFRALTDEVLDLDMNIATGNGGTCYGDSGGPHFIGATDVIASITFLGDIPCVSNDVSYRVDTAVARAFLQDYLTLS